MPTVRMLVLLAVTVVGVPAAHAADYYVKNGGNDGLDGLTLATAWATLGHAADEVGPGDTVHVQNGSYQGFYLTTSGTAGSPITFKAEGSAVLITGDNGTTPDGINLEGASHVVIDGFVVNNRGRAGIRAVLGEFVTVRNCHAGYNGRWGILTGFVDDFTAEHNETHHSIAEHGIYVSNSGDRPILRGNHTHDNNFAGIHMNGDESQGGDGQITGALVEDNLVNGNGVGNGASGINMDGVSDSVVRNNLLYDNHASGISLYAIDGAEGSSGNLVVNNTIVMASNGRWAVNIRDGSTGNRIVNNVLYNLHSFRGAITIDPASRPGFTSDYNAVISRFSVDDGDTVIDLADWQAEGYDLHSFVATPAQLFVAAGSDFHLKPGSPAIDEGSAADAPPADLEGNPRPVGAGVDIGAYEVQLVECGDGGGDPGEQCGEPGLSCADPCTTCSGCTCVAPPPVCGDALVCGSETCESDGDCGGEVCSGCACVNPPVCASGITITKPTLKLRVAPGSLRFQGEAVIPKPWQAVNPAVNGARLVVDAVHGGGGVDITLPGGSAWKVNRSGTQWTYGDKTGAVAGVTKALLKDRSKTTSGLVRLLVQGKPAGLVLPPASATRATFVVGAPSECASVVWNPPGGLKPRCTPGPGKLACR